MTWILASFLMFVSSIILYLAVRQSSLSKNPTQINNLAMFIFPAIVFCVIAVINKTDLSLNLFQFILIIIQAIFFSYLGNVMSLKSIEKAPNPGYSLVISKSYVVFTSIVSIFMFGSELTTKSIIAILIIIAFSPLLMLSETKTKNEKFSSSWLPLAMGAFFCWGSLALSSKYLYTIGVNIIERLIYSTTIVSLLILFETRHKKISFHGFSKKQIWPLIIIGLAGTTYIYYTQVGFDLAPNIGYVNAINAASIAGVTIFSAILFKDELTIKKLIGIIGIISGLIILVI